MEELIIDKKPEQTVYIEQLAERITGEMKKVLVAQDETIRLLLAGIFVNGHILLEGVPGIAKTLTAKLLARTMSLQFSRLQFTPDLMPTDVIGTSVFDLKTSDFIFKKGPVFSNIVLIDEINRAPSKTQASLFEVMEEMQVTVDGFTYKMDEPFIVIATQNPIEQEGTYKLPEAQLDRFLFRLKLNYPALEDEKEVLRRFQNDFKGRIISEVKCVINAEELATCKKIVEQITIADELIGYIAMIVHATRNNGDIFLGASTRASLSILRASKAMAALDGRLFVTPDDIKTVADPVLNHRIILTPEREIEGVDVKEVLQSIIKTIEVPR